MTSPGSGEGHGARRLEIPPGRQSVALAERVVERVELPTARVVQMRELNQHTSAVLDEINRSGSPAVITKHGRFIALITPLAGHSVESMVLRHDPKIRELMQQGLDERGAVESGLTVAESRAQLHGHR